MVFGTIRRYSASRGTDWKVHVLEVYTDNNNNNNNKNHSYVLRQIYRPNQRITHDDRVDHNRTRIARGSKNFVKSCVHTNRPWLPRVTGLSTADVRWQSSEISIQCGRYTRRRSTYVFRQKQSRRASFFFSSWSIVVVIAIVLSFSLNPKEILLNEF